MWMEYNRLFFFQLRPFFFLHIAIREGWLGLLPPPRLLRRGLVGLWLVAAVAHFNCTYDFFSR